MSFFLWRGASLHESRSQEKTGTIPNKNILFLVPVFVFYEKDCNESANKKMVAHKVLPFFIFSYKEMFLFCIYNKDIFLALIENNALFHNKSILLFVV